ncbi:MAG: M20/M25/M40 family metallo-hydrolase [Fimbriimonadaceae bacterium]
MFLAALMIASQSSGPSADRLLATVEKLASFHTRNSLSTGLTEACEWIAGEYRSIPGVEAELMKYTLQKGRRIPEDTPAVQVVAVLPGETDTRVLIGGHIDSLNLAVDPKSGRAPGANDDASGVAVALECARLLSGKKLRNTLVFVAFSGEEQGLLGARALATRAKDSGWHIVGVLNNDTVGSSINLEGQSDRDRVRVFSEEGDHGSRELARYVAWINADADNGFGIKLVFRRDRFGRGGDHTPFVEAGFPGVRFIEVFEEYTRQHTPEDLPQHVDKEYLAKVCRANLLALEALAMAGPAPENVRISRDQGHSTTVLWQATKGERYGVYWRETTSPVWQGMEEADDSGRHTIKGVNKDDHIFAVGSLPGVPVEAK